MKICERGDCLRAVSQSDVLYRTNVGFDLEMIVKVETRLPGVYGSDDDFHVENLVNLVKFNPSIRAMPGDGGWTTNYTLHFQFLSRFSFESVGSIREWKNRRGEICEDCEVEERGALVVLIRHTVALLAKIAASSFG